MRRSTRTNQLHTAREVHRNNVLKDTDFRKRPSITDERLITAAMTYLRYHDSSNASRENAISLLAFMQTVAKEVSMTMTEEAFDQYYEAFKEHQAKQQS